MQELFNKNKFNPLVSSLVIGVIWALWHLPLFYIPGVSQYQGNFMLFFMGVMGLSLVLTVLYSVSNSIWLCVVFHSLSNTSYALGFDVEHSDTTGLIIQNSIPVVMYHPVKAHSSLQRIHNQSRQSIHHRCLSLSGRGQACSWLRYRWRTWYGVSLCDRPAACNILHASILPAR